VSRLWLAGVAIVVTAFVVTGLVIALVTTRGQDLLPEETPEGTVQRYLLALEDRDFAEAYTYLASDPSSPCTQSDFVREASRYVELRDSSMTLEDTQVFDGTAIVTAHVTVFDPEISFPPSEYSYDRTFEVVLEDDIWRLVRPEFSCFPLY
jgi:hypothetical protein